MDAYTQTHRQLQIDTILGKDRVLPVSLRGRDLVSSCFVYDVQLASSDHAIQAADILGTPATIRLNDGIGLVAPVNGIVSRFAAVGRGAHGMWLYRIQVVPDLWLLTRTADCRIFHPDKDVKEIVEEILGEYGIAKREWRLNGLHNKRTYCVQYRESAHDFICRLLEEEGIFFYFTHDDKNHCVVFTDNNRGLAKCANTRIAIAPDTGSPGGVWRWESNYRFRSGKWAQSDYNFETPSTDLNTKLNTVNPVLGKRPLEIFDYPGGYLSKDPGEALTKLRIEYEEATYQDITGEGSCIGFNAGACFTLVNPETSEADKEYIITSVEHAAEDWSQVTQDAEPPSYTNRFRCALRSAPYRPEMKTPRPRIHGTQTAVVTGPSGEEIFTDKYGRIKVQFFWDRQGKKDDHSSCWIRVAQNWAGRNWGTWYLPRIGQEVVVAFLEGDPDRPLVVGSVYNAEQMVPFELPANKTQSGLRTRSSLKGSPANVNEFRFEDKKGSELVYLHAEKDTATETEHDKTHWVGHDETTTVDNNRTETVHANETITIDKNRTETVHMNEMVTIDMNRAHTIMLNEALTVGVARVHTVGAAEAITVGAARSITVGDDQSIEVGNNESTSIGKDRSTSVGENETLDVGKTITITAGDQIVLKTGSATITMKKNGDITIEGKQINIKGSADVVIKGQKIDQN